MHHIKNSHDHHASEPHEDYDGLHRDLIATGSMISRRHIMRMAASVGASAGVLQLLGCNRFTDLTGSENPGTGSCSRIPTETAGPFPGDGSNGANVLNVTGVVRNDIRTSFGTLSGTAVSVPLIIALTLVNASTCVPLASRAVYLWHCDRAGLYSLYSAGATNQNYLRGVAQTDTNGQVTFTSSFRLVTLDVGRTFTSKRFQRLRVQPTLPTRWPRLKSRCPKRLAISCTRRPVMRKVFRISRRSLWRATTSSAMARRWSWQRAPAT